VTASFTMTPTVALDFLSSKTYDEYARTKTI